MSAGPTEPFDAKLPPDVVARRFRQIMRDEAAKAKQEAAPTIVRDAPPRTGATFAWWVDRLVDAIDRLIKYLAKK